MPDTGTFYFTQLYSHKHLHALYLSFTKQKGCQVFNSYVRSSNYALLAIAKLPNNELTSIHTLSLPPLLL